MRHLLRALCALLLISMPLAAQPLADRVPADAIVYVGWRGSDDLGPAYKGSHLQAVVNASDFAATWEKVRPRILSEITGNNPERTGQIEDALALLTMLRKHPSAIFFSGVDIDAPEPLPRQALMCRAGADTAAMIEKCGKLTALSQGRIKVSQVDDLVVVSMGLDDPAAALGKTGANNGLAQSSAFRDALGQVDADPVNCIFVDFEKAFALIDSGMTKAPEEARQIWPKVRDASGLGAMKRWISTGAFSGKAWSAQRFLEVTGEPRGLLSVAPSEKIDDALLARVPQESTYAMYSTFNAVRLVEEARNIAASANPHGAEFFDRGMGAAQMALGRNLQTEILAPLGHQWAAYTAPAAGVGGNSILGLVIVNKLDDAKKAQQGLVGLTYGLTNMLAGVARQQGINLKVQQQKLGEATEYFWETNQLMVAPAWVIKDGMLYLGANRDAVAAAANFQGNGKSISDNAKFGQLRDQLKPPAPGAFEFADLAETAPELFQSLDQQSAVWVALLQREGIQIDKLPLPSLQAIQPELGPMASVSWRDARGFHTRELKPFPFSDFLAAQKVGGGLTTVGVASLGVSILLPSLNRARETANRVKCASNMRQIGQAILLYGNENKGKNPPDLGTLITTQDITWQCFVCPDSDTKFPADKLREGADIAKWVNEHSDYVYIGQKLTTAAPAEKILLYESTDHHVDGCNMLFGDGHVEFVMKSAAAAWSQAGEQPANGNR